MKTQNSKNLILTLFVSVVLMACSGGETGTGLSGRDNIVSIGAITGFGSVYVNGVKYDTNNAEIKLNGSQAAEADLSLGMVVAVSGSLRGGDKNNGVADSIDYYSEIEGVVTSVGDTLEVMGIAVSYDEQSEFESPYVDVTAISDVAEGAVVEISGFSTGVNQLYATRFELKDKSYNGGALSVRGTITALNNLASTFRFGNMEVFYDQSTKIDDKIPNQQLVDGLAINLKSVAGFNQQGQLIASEIESATYIDIVVGTKVEMEGLVFAPNVAASEFMLNGIKVTFDDRTEFKYGDSTNLTEGVKVEVEGTLVSSGQLAAEEISFRGEGNAVISARAYTTDVSASQLKVLGTSITVNNFTIMKDNSEANLKDFALQDINSADMLDIRAFKDLTSSDLVATMVKRLEANSSDDTVVLKGVLEEVSVGYVIVSGITVDTSNVENNAIPTAIDSTVTVTGTATLEANQITAISF